MKYNFINRVIPIWNSLPNCMVAAVTVITLLEIVWFSFGLIRK